MFDCHLTTRLSLTQALRTQWKLHASRVLQQHKQQQQKGGSIAGGATLSEAEVARLSAFLRDDSSSSSSASSSSPPLLEATELVLDAATGELRECAGRAPGLNDVGMVAWRMVLRTPECPAGRPLILIGNDIAHQV